MRWRSLLAAWCRVDNTSIIAELLALFRTHLSTPWSPLGLVQLQVANMHGDETSGRMLLPMLAEWLCANRNNDTRASRIIDNMHLVRAIAWRGCCFSFAAYQKQQHGMLRQ